MSEQTIRQVKVCVDYDQDASEDCPNDWGCWRVYSFNTRHRSYDKTVTPEKINAWLAAGRAFLLSYYEHGGHVWTLRKELPLGCQCPWDSVDVAGVVVWEDDAMFPYDKEEEAKESARGFVEVFDDWSNDRVFSITFPEEDEKYGLGGIIGVKDVLFHLYEDYLADGEEFVFEGDASYGLSELWDRYKDELDNDRKDV